MVKALVVDDSRAIRMLLNKTLRQLGYEVQEAANGREALEMIEAGNSGVKLVLADWNMPEMNGLDLLKRLRQNPGTHFPGGGHGDDRNRNRTDRGSHGGRRQRVCDEAVHSRHSRRKAPACGNPSLRSATCPR